MQFCDGDDQGKAETVPRRGTASLTPVEPACQARQVDVIHAWPVIFDREDRPRRRRGASLDELPEIGLVAHDGFSGGLGWRITRR